MDQKWPYGAHISLCICIKLSECSLYVYLSQHHGGWCRDWLQPRHTRGVPNASAPLQRQTQKHRRQGGREQKFYLVIQIFSNYAGIILCMRPADKKWCYNVTAMRVCSWAAMPYGKLIPDLSALNSMAWQRAETLMEIRGTLVNIRGTTKKGSIYHFPKHEFNGPVCLEMHICHSSSFHHICNIKCRLDCRYSPQNIFNAKNFNPHKKSISLLNVPICTQGMQRTCWPEAGTIIDTGPYSQLVKVHVALTWKIMLQWCHSFEHVIQMCDLIA